MIHNNQVLAPLSRRAKGILYASDGVFVEGGGVKNPYYDPNDETSLPTLYPGDPGYNEAVTSVTAGENNITDDHTSGDDGTTNITIENGLGISGDASLDEGAVSDTLADAAPATNATGLTVEQVTALDAFNKDRMDKGLPVVSYADMLKIQESTAATAALVGDNESAMMDAAGTTTSTSTAVPDQTIKSDPVVVEEEDGDPDDPANDDEVVTATNNLTDDQKNSIGSKAMEFFGIDKRDVGRFLLYYMGGRLSGGSHAGSMQWAGKAVVGEMQKKDALRQQKSAQDQKLVNEYLKMARKLKSSGALKDDESYKELINAINTGDFVAIEEAFGNKDYFTQKHNLGLDDEDIVEVYRPGYLQPISGWKTEGGFYADPDGDGVYQVLSLSDGFREYSSDQDHPKDVNQLVKSSFDDDIGYVWTGEGDKKKKVGISNEEITEVTVNFANQQGGLGRPNDPRHYITGVNNALDFMKANNIPITRQSLEGVLWAQATGGAEFADPNKLTTIKDGELVYLSNTEIKGLATDLDTFTSEIENEDPSSFLRDADDGWKTSKESFDATKAANGEYGKVDPKWASKIKSAPSPYWAYVYWMMATEGNTE